MKKLSWYLEQKEIPQFSNAGDPIWGLLLDAEFADGLKISITNDPEGITANGTIYLPMPMELASDGPRGVILRISDTQFLIRPSLLIKNENRPITISASGIHKATGTIEEVGKFRAMWDRNLLGPSIQLSLTLIA